MSLFTFTLQPGMPANQTAYVPLLAQDNSIPGNRTDGFRYHHLLFIIAITPVYLWFELSFGVHLLDNIGGNVSLESVDAVEHWGRLISGMAVSLLFLSGWIRQSEKLDKPWPVRVLVSIAIVAVCIPLTWLLQDQVIDFYVKRGTAEIALNLAALSVVTVIGYVILRTWLRVCVLEKARGSLIAIAGLAAILLMGIATLKGVTYLLPIIAQRMGMADAITSRLGVERQRAATLTLVRRGIQEDVYTLDRIPFSTFAAASPEGKAALALFPILGSVLDQTKFSADRPRILRALMFKDWRTQHGARNWEIYKGLADQIDTTFHGPYRDAQSRRQPVEVDFFAGKPLRAGLSREAFWHDNTVTNFLRAKMGCLDCTFNPDMDRGALELEMFTWTQQGNIDQMLKILESAAHFEKGHDGETAARTYWVPIWALLFSMLGAFTHIFRLVFTIAEYTQRNALHLVHASDSPLADELVRRSRLVVAAAVSALVLFVYFSDNRITGSDAYLQLRDRMWRQHPIVGAIAAHWTINAQGLVYPFTKKLRPSWLEFRSDPIAWVPFRVNAAADDR